MRPSEILYNANGKVPVESAMVWIVMAYGGNPGQQIAQAAPPQPRRLRNLQVFTDGRLFRFVDVAGPLLGVRIPAESQPGKQAELEVIVGIDEARNDQASVQVERLRAFSAGRSRRAQCRNLSTAYFDVQLCCLVSAECCC